MVKFDAFDIHLDQPNGCYYAGQAVQGKLLTSSPYLLQLNELSVTLKGEARTHWVEKISDNIYDSLEPYLNDRQIIVGQSPNSLSTTQDQPFLLTPGSHTVPFQFRLPPHLPSSYEGEFGYVRYTLVAHADISPVNQDYSNYSLSAAASSGIAAKGKETVVDRAITVFASVELKQLSTANDCGASKEDTMEMIGCCGSGGHLAAVISIPKTAFLVGQTIPIRIDLENQTSSSNRRRSQALVTFVREMHFKSVSLFQSAHDQKCVSRVIDSVKMDHPEQGKMMFKEVGIRVPVDLAPTSVGNTLITVTYKIRLELGKQCELVLPVGVASKA